MAGKSMKPGGGGRFAKLKAKLGASPGVTNPGALAASIGRQKYGAAKMAKFSAQGRKRAAHNTLVDYGNAGAADQNDSDTFGLPDMSENKAHDKRTPHPAMPEMHAAGTHALDGLIKEHLAQAAKHEAAGAAGRLKADEHRSMARELRANHPMYGPRVHKGPEYP